MKVTNKTIKIDNASFTPILSVSIDLPLELMMDDQALDPLAVENFRRKLYDTIMDQPITTPKQYNIGKLTQELVFEKAGLTNLSDLQKVLDAVEAALESK